MKPLRVFSAVALLVVSGSVALAQGAAVVIGPDSAGSVVRHRIDAGRAKAIVLAVVRPDGSKYVVAMGEERPGKTVDEQTIFEIGSITKTFTAILLSDMVNRGEVRLDQPVTELLPAGTKVPSRNGRRITLGDLSSQISGLARMPDNFKPADPSNPYADYTVAQMYDFLSRYELPRDPGTTYEYSNLGVGLLGHALALRAGKSYEALVRERILVPLGMTHTAITLSPEMRAHMAEGHDAAGTVVPLWDIPTLAGAGALRSSLEDMLKYLNANRVPANDGLGRAIAQTHVARFTVNNALSLGLNWHISSFQGDTMIWHNGGTAGFRTIVGWNPRTGAGAILLGNMSQDPDDIVRHILLRTPLATVVVHKEITLAPNVLANYVGTYEFSPTFSIAVTLENGALVAQATDQPKFALFAEAPDKFFLKVVDAQLEFARDSSGAVTSATLVQNGRAVGKKVR